MENSILQTETPCVFAAGMNTRSTVKDATDIDTYTWENGRLYTAETHEVGSVDNRVRSMYLKLAYSSFPRNPRIKKAEFTLHQHSSTLAEGAAPRMALYRVDGTLTDGTCEQPTHNDMVIDYAQMNGNSAAYTFDVTRLIDTMVSEGATTVSLVLTPMDEADGCIALYGVDWNGNLDYYPKLQVEYESTYGVNTTYCTHTHEIGAYGQGSVDLQCGNLMFEMTDFEWGGNRMPVTIKHLYNSSLSSCQYMNSDVCGSYADFSGMQIGYGWKLNVMQSLYPMMIWAGNEMIDAWKYVDENGNATYLKENSDGKFEDTDGGLVLDTRTLTLTQGDETYTFDNETLRLTAITDSHGNRLQIVYNEQGKITAVKDGVDRAFTFGYSGDSLTSVTAPDGTRTTYTYDGNYLQTVTHPDGSKTEFVTADGRPADVIIRSGNTPLYKTHYTFGGDRVESVTEYGVQNGAYVLGTSSAYDYDTVAHRTRVTSVESAEDAGEEDREIYTVYTFDADGDVIDSYVYTKDADAIGIGGVGIQPYMSEDGTKTISHSMNLLADHGFAEPVQWGACGCMDDTMSVSFELDERIAKHGTHYLKVKSDNGDNMETGAIQTLEALPAGEYTFSAFVTVPHTVEGLEPDIRGAFLRVVTQDHEIIGQSEYLSQYDDSNVRLIVPFALETEQSIDVRLMLNGKGEAWFSAPQLERNPYATAYNLLENGNFERNDDMWRMYNAGDTSSGGFDMSQLLTVSGDLDGECYAYQDVAVAKRRTTRETFTLSGWAKGCGLPDHEREGLPAPQFRLRAEIRYADAEDGAEPETYTADFTPCTEEWQYASVQFAKSDYRAVQCIRVYCDYGYNIGKAYFDAVQLTCDEQEYDLSAADFATEPDDEEETAPVTDILDDEQDEPDEFTEITDEFGNRLTETTFADGAYGTIYGYCSYGLNGNDLHQVQDSRYFCTDYDVDDTTSRVRTVTDRCGVQTDYEYDAAGRVISVSGFNGSDPVKAQTTYEYNAFGDLTRIGVGHGLVYCLNYNAQHKLASIGIEQKSENLIAYEYKNGSGRLKSVTYANGNVMKATYNTLGQMVGETWYETAESAVPTARYKYVYDAEGELVRSVDITAEKEYTYTYENGLLLRTAEYGIVLNANDIIVSRTLLCATTYTYKEQTPVRKRIVWADGTEHTVFYEQTEGENDVVKFRLPYGTEEDPDAQRTVLFHSAADKLGRKEFDELQIGTGFISRRFSYHDGGVCGAYAAEGKLKSAPTTALVEKIEFSNGNVWAYEYDPEERITQVRTPYDGTFYYTYDDLGQLLTETREYQNTETVINEMTYDNYGNILSKNGVTYTYADSGWLDLLLSVGNQTISYDAQGNPVNYLGHTLTWEKGRQLRSFDANTYTYNASGIRTSKMVGGIRHDYTLDGAKILRESWNGNTLIPLYDTEDSICGIVYNNEPYYFLKNLQGDIIGITDRDGNAVAKYSYDAWGVCTVTNYQGTVGTVNPFRYRGYYYDAETGLYYLQTRYYDSAIGRFISSDDASYVAIDETVISCNIFAYCKNAPSSAIDNSGCNSASIAQGSYQWAYMLSAVVPAVAAAKAGIIAAIKSALAFLWNVFVVVGLVLLVIILIAAICVTAAKVLTLVQEAVKTNKYKGASGYVVYVLTRKKNKPNRIFYVGRTKNFSKRMKSHQRNKKPCYGYIVVVCKSYAASRAIEQAVLSACIVSKVFAIDKGRIPNGSNRMRGIAKDSVKNFKNNLSDLTSLMSCTSDSDILNLMGY